MPVTAAGRWSIYKWGWQCFSSKALDDVPFFGAFGAAWDHAMVARSSANPLGVLWPEINAAFVSSGGNGGAPLATATRPVVLIWAG